MNSSSARIGYARVSTADQNFDAQIAALEAAGCTMVRTRKMMQDATIRAGGTVEGSITMRTNFVVLGTYVTPAWGAPELRPQDREGDELPGPEGNRRSDRARRRPGPSAGALGAVGQREDCLEQSERRPGPKRDRNSWRGRSAYRDWTEKKIGSARSRARPPKAARNRID